MSANTKTADAIIVEPGDKRLAMQGMYPDRAAWFEDQMDDGPIFIVVTRAATDERLASLGRRFNVEPAVLIDFRDSLASEVIR